MIEVKNLTKRYGAHTAVSDISFTIERGKIYGFLGPNGAGKSTTMNIITGCLAATSGTVLIDGHDIFEEPLAAKKLIGFLPEIPPLYTDMTPLEYLCFVAKAKGVNRNEMQEQIEYAMDKTKINEVANRLIKNLSKGYRQRVGIAQALLGNPGIIILDEPTVGLDPAQIIEIRDLIKELGNDHTVILSSHILPEVNEICEHIMIISKGVLVASDTKENLMHMMTGSNNIDLTLKAGADKSKAILEDILDIDEIKVIGEHDGQTDLELISDGDTDVREAVFMACAQAMVPILNMNMRKVSLEDVFMEMTSDKHVEQVSYQEDGGEKA